MAEHEFDNLAHASGSHKGQKVKIETVEEIFMKPMSPVTLVKARARAAGRNFRNTFQES